VSQLDPAELLARADRAAEERWPGAQLADLQPLPGGVSSLTFSARLRAGGSGGERDRRVVVKVAPPGLAPVRNRDVLRQGRVMEALHGAPGVAVPEVLFRDGA
jgi:hypothetical protein